MDIVDTENDVPPNARLVEQREDDRFNVYYDNDQEVINFNTIRDQMRLAEQRGDAKHERAKQVKHIKVVTQAGNEFDGDIDSQNAMMRKIIVMDILETTVFTLADNTIANITRDELLEALRLSIVETDNLWSI